MQPNAFIKGGGIEGQRGRGAIGPPHFQICELRGLASHCVNLVLRCQRAGTYTASDNALQGRGSGHARLVLTNESSHAIPLIYI